MAAIFLKIWMKCVFQPKKRQQKNNVISLLRFGQWKAWKRIFLLLVLLFANPSGCVGVDTRWECSLFLVMHIFVWIFRHTKYQFSNMNYSHCHSIEYAPFDMNCVFYANDTKKLNKTKIYQAKEKNKSNKFCMCVGRKKLQQQQQQKQQQFNRGSKVKRMSWKRATR